MTTDNVIEAKKAAFLRVFARTANVSGACRAAKVGRSSVYAWLEHDEQFSGRYREAEIESTELLEDEARRRGVEGVPEPVYQRGVEVGTVQRYSDSLLMFLLKARRPDKYRERYQVENLGHQTFEVQNTSASDVILARLDQMARRRRGESIEPPAADGFDLDGFNRLFEQTTEDHDAPTSETSDD